MHIPPTACRFAFAIIFVSCISCVEAVDLARLQYGQQNRHHIMLCAQGDFAAALDYANRYVVDHPNDLEAYYIMAMAQANLGKLDDAVKTVQRSLDKGLTLDRYLAGPRDLFAPLYQHSAFQDLVARKDVRLVHGPVLGAVTADGVGF